MSGFSTQRFFAYLKKETIQILRDPSTTLIAYVLPLILMFIFGYGVSLDADHISIGLLIEDTSPNARSLEAAFTGTPYFDVTTSYNRTKLEDDLAAGLLRGVVVIPQDFSENLLRGTQASLQVLVDGSEPNTANFVLNYAQGVLKNWTDQLLIEKKNILILPIDVQARVWFNSELKSREVLVPGSLAIILSLIGILLTALVIAREWERGTMEAIMSTPIRISEMLLGKLIPYFFLGLGSMTLCLIVAIFLYDVPFRGSLWILFMTTSVYLIAALGQGLLISTLARVQFVASQAAIIVGFLPAIILSGFIFEISSMPWPIQVITYLFVPRYFVDILKTTFLTGTVWEVILPNMMAMIFFGVIFLGLSLRKMTKVLD
jgi:ABC-2 type transport system permease protein